MNRRVGLVVLLLAELGFLISCGQRDGIGDIFSEESFNTRIELRDGRQIVVDDLLLGQPTLIRFHPDSFLVIGSVPISVSGVAGLHRSFTS